MSTLVCKVELLFHYPCQLLQHLKPSNEQKPASPGDHLHYPKTIEKSFLFASQTLENRVKNTYTERIV